MADILIPLTSARYERKTFFQTIDSLAKTSELTITVGGLHEDLGSYPYEDVLNRINDNRIDDYLVEIVPDTFALRSSMLTDITSVRLMRDNMYEILVRHKRYYVFGGHVQMIVENINQANRILSQESAEDDYDSDVECAQRLTPPDRPSKKRLKLVDGPYINIQT